MEDIQEYGIGFSIDKKSYSQIMKFEKRINDMYNKINKAAIDSDKKTTKSKEQAEKAKIKAQEASERKQKQLNAKALKEAKRLEDNRLRVFRSATFEKLSLDQKMNLTRVIKNAKTVEELKDQERKLTSFYKRENKRREKMLRNKARAAGRTTQGGFNTGAVGSFGGTGGRLAAAGTMLASAMMNPITAAAVGVAAIIAGSVSALRTGTDKFQDLRAGAAVSGSDLSTLKQKTFVYQSVAGKEYSVDKVADILANIQEKAGEVRDYGTIGKDGLVTGGGEGADFVNALIKNGVIAPDMEAVRKYLDLEDPIKLMEKIAKDLNENVKDEKARRFAFESINDWGKLNSALVENKHRVQGLEQQYEEMDMGIAPENIDSVKELTATLNTMGAAWDNLSLKFTEGFSSMLSPETLAMFEDFTAKLNPAFYWIGKVIGAIVEAGAVLYRFQKAIMDFILPFTTIGYAIEQTKDAFNGFPQTFKYVSDSIDSMKEAFDSSKETINNFWISMKDGWNNIIDWITNKFTGFVDSIKNAMNKISDEINDTFSWFTGGSDKKETSNVPSANASNFFMASPTTNIPSVKETQARANRSVSTGQPTQVVLQVDKEKLGSVVIDTNSFEGGVGNVLYPMFR